MQQIRKRGDVNEHILPHLQVDHPQLIIFLFDSENVPENLQHGRGSVHSLWRVSE